MGHVLRIGIDIGSRAIKVVWTTTSRAGAPQWHWAQRMRHPSDPPEQLTRTLRELLRPLGTLRYHVPVRLAVSESHLRQVLLQVANTKQLTAVIPEQIARLFPFDSSRCRYQTHLFEQRPINGALACTVQAAACDTSVLQYDLQPLWQIGWVPSEALPKALAVLALAVAHGQLDEQPVLLLELGARHSMLAIAAKGHVVFARDINMGSDFLTDALTSQVTVGQEQMQLSWEDAEALKCRVGIPDSEASTPSPERRLPLGTYQALIQPVLDQWLGEIQRTIAFSVQDQPQAVPQKLLMCGGGSQLRGVDRWLTQQVGLPVERLTVRPLLGEDLPGVAIACGLLVAPDRIALNLLPHASRQARQLIRGLRATITGLLVMVLGLWLAIGLCSVQLRSLQRQAAPIRMRLKELEPIRTLTQVVEAHTSRLNALVGSTPDLVAWLARLPEEFLAAVRLRALTLGPRGQVEMSGQAQTREQSPEAYVSEFALWLEQARLCRDVRLGETERHGTEESLVEFSVTCQRL